MAADPTDAERARVLERHGRPFEAGQVIYREGDPTDKAYLIEQGRVRIFKRIGGAERGLRVVSRGDLFGEDALLADTQRSATAISLAPGTALAFDEDSLLEVLREAPSIGVTLMKKLVLRARESEERIQIGLLRDAQSKVILGLLRAAQAAPEGASRAITLDLSPLDLSARVGLDVDAVKRTVQQLREADYLQVSEETLEIPDLSLLQELYGLLEAGEEIVGGDAR
jgi:CRP-like cAMP-binding protein